MNRSRLPGKIWALFVISHFLFPMISSAEYRKEITPRMSVSQVYDDNIYLDNTDEKSDFIITISPGLNLAISSLNKTLSIDYAPTWVWYDKYDQNNTVRHAGRLDYRQDMAEHLRFDLTNTYIQSEEPVEAYEGMEMVRNTRNKYQRNRGSAALSYQFGKEDSLDIGYRNNLLENEDPTLDDGTIQNPFINIAYWLSIKNGFEFNYDYTRAIFWRDNKTRPGDDYAGNAAGLSYIRRFTPHTRGSIGYEFTNRDFEGMTENYEIHEETLGFEHAFSPDLSLSLQAGSFTQKNERSADRTGYSYNASLAKRFEHGNLSLGGQGGWEEAYLEAEKRGFIRYWSADSRLEYLLMERLNSYINGSFRREIDSEDRQRQSWRGTLGLRLDFLQWFSIALDYTHRGRDDDNDTLDYMDNRVMLTLTASKPYRW